MAAQDQPRQIVDFPQGESRPSFGQPPIPDQSNTAAADAHALPVDVRVPAEKLVRTNITASLHAEGLIRHAAARPEVWLRTPNGLVRRNPGPKVEPPNLGKAPEPPRTGSIALDQVPKNPSIRELAFEDFEIGVPPIPLNPADIEVLRESVSLVGQTTPVLLRELPDGTLALLDGGGVLRHCAPSDALQFLRSFFPV